MKLKTEVSLYVYEQRYQKIKFFEGRDLQLIVWMCPLLKPVIFEDRQYIFIENEKVDGIFFMISGQASFVLPRFKNLQYINITMGHLFGLIDIIGSL